jgi:hypothetical protein
MILFTTSILPEAALHAYFRNSSAIHIEAENHASPAPVIHISGRAVTNREQWHDPDTSGSVSSQMRGVYLSNEWRKLSVCASGSGLTLYKSPQRSHG